MTKRGEDPSVDAPRHLNRREALIGTGLVGAGALAAMMSGCGASAAATTGSRPGLTGSWRVAVTVDDGSHHDALMLCTADGGIAVAAALPPSTFGVGCGAWERNGSQLNVTFQSFVFAGTGELAGVLRIHGPITIDQSGDRLGADVKYDVAPTAGANFSHGGSATWTGSRVKPLPS